MVSAQGLDLGPKRNKKKKSQSLHSLAMSFVSCLEMHVFGFVNHMNVFDIFFACLKFKLVFGSGHFPHFENVPTAACHCKQLARRISTGPSAELLKSCKNDTTSATIRVLRDWTERQAQ